MANVGKLRSRAGPRMKDRRDGRAGERSQRVWRPLSRCTDLDKDVAVEDQVDPEVAEEGATSIVEERTGSIPVRSRGLKVSPRETRRV